MRGLESRHDHVENGWYVELMPLLLQFRRSPANLFEERGPASIAIRGNGEAYRRFWIRLGDFRRNSVDEFARRFDLIELAQAQDEIPGIDRGSLCRLHDPSKKRGMEFRAARSDAEAREALVAQQGPDERARRIEQRVHIDVFEKAALLQNGHRSFGSRVPLGSAHAL